MALAIHILAHKQPTQVERLVRALLRPGHTLVLHFDRRAPASLHALGKELAATHSNVILQRPRSVVWFGWQGLHTQLEAIALALKHSARWTHFITLSGADFPLQPIEKTEAWLATVPSTSFVSWFDPAEKPLWGDATTRIERYHLASPLFLRFLQTPLLGRKIKAIFGWTNAALPWVPGVRRKYPAGWPYLGGSNWCMLSRSASEWLTTDPAAISFARWIRHVACPDEMYYQSTLCSDRFSGAVENGSGHFIEFAAGAASPRVFREEDFDRLIASGRAFARKFDETIDAKILDALERHVQISSPTS